LQGDTKVPLLAINIRPSINQVVISTLTLTQTGTIQTSTGTPPNLPGDGDLSKLYVYLDSNNDGHLQTGSDTLMGSLPWGTTNIGAFFGGTITIPLSVPVTFNTSGGTLIVAADVAAIDGSSTSTQGHQAGIAIAGPSGIGMSPSTALQDPANT